MMDDDYGGVGGMRIDRGNRSTRRKPAPVPLCPPQIPHFQSKNLLQRANDDDNLLKNVITSDETWIYSYDVMTVLTLKKPCFASPQKSPTGVLASENNAACYF
jgi:hypothetical protein